MSRIIIIKGRGLLFSLIITYCFLVSGLKYWSIGLREPLYLLCQEFARFQILCLTWNGIITIWYNNVFIALCSVRLGGLNFTTLFQVNEKLKSPYKFREKGCVNVLSFVASSFCSQTILVLKICLLSSYML